MGQQQSEEQGARNVSTEQLSHELALRFARKCFTPLEITHFKDVFRSLADEQDGIHYWKEETLCRFLVIPDALGPGPLVYQMATYLGAFPFPSLAPSILTIEAMLKVVVIMTERYGKVLKNGKADRNKLLFRSLAVFDRRMSSVHEKPSKEVLDALREEQSDSGEQTTTSPIQSHMARFSIDQPANDDEEEEDDDELALAALDSLDAIEVFKLDQRADTKIHHAQIPIDNFRRLLMLLLIIAPLDAQESLSRHAERLTAARVEGLRRVADSILWSFTPEQNPGIFYQSFNTIIPSSLPHMFDGLNPLFEHFLFSKNIDLSRRRRQSSFSTPLSSPSKTSPTVAQVPDTPLEPLLPREGEILDLNVLSQLAFFLKGSNLFRRLRPLYMGGDAGFSMGSIEQKVFNWRAPSILLVAGTRLPSEPEGARERAFADLLSPKRFPNGASGNSTSGRVVFGAYLDVPWKHTYKEAIGGPGALLFQLEPIHEVFRASTINKEYATFTKHGVTFGSPPPLARPVSGLSQHATLGAVSLVLDAALEFGVFNHDTNGGGSFHPSQIRETNWQERFEIESLEVWGCGGDEEAEKQKAAWAFEEREAAARKSLRMGKDVEADRALLEMAGLIGNHNASGGSMALAKAATPYFERGILRSASLSQNTHLFVPRPATKGKPRQGDASIVANAPSGLVLFGRGTASSEFLHSAFPGWTPTVNASFNPSLIANDSKENAKMTKSARAAKLPPIVPSRQGSSGVTDEPGFRGWGVFSFPPSNRLVITTTRGVYIWDVYGISEIFRSSSQGIVAAKMIVSGSEMLAVADSQVVVLHDISGGVRRSYRLKGSGGQVRLLEYAKESKNLFFTTALQNSVQTYSLKHSKLLDPAHIHPSPPSVFALSCGSRYLLSTSLTPPTIHLTSLAHNTPPILLRPQFSTAAVVAAGFHPEREDYFCLAFADGTAAVYDANHFYNSHGNGERRENAAILSTGGEKAFVRGLHIGTMTRNAATEGGVAFEGHHSGTDLGGIGGKEFGISAVAFVPGRKATVVTVGADGKCCVVDFTQPSKQKAILLKSWHIRRPATSLSVICSAKTANINISQPERADDPESESRHDLPNESYYIAVGRSDGRVLLFDLDGKALGEQALDDKGARIVDVEWTQIRSGATLPYQSFGSSIRRSPVVKKKRKSLGSSTVAKSQPLQMELLATSSNLGEHSEDPLFDFTTPRKTLGAFHWEPSLYQPAMDPRDGYENNAIVEVDKRDDSQRSHVTPKSSSANLPRNAIQSSSQTETERSSSFRSSTEADWTPSIPPRPIPKPGGRLSIRRDQITRLSRIKSTSHPSIIAKARIVSSSNPRLSKGLSIANASTKTKVLFGPRNMASPRPTDSRDSTSTSGVQILPEQSDDGWLDVPPETPRRAAGISPVSSATSKLSYKTAVSRHIETSGSAERSDDTVVDWTASLPRQPVPTLQITYPSGERSQKVKSKRKGHISLSVSSESAGRLTPTPPVSDAVANPISGSSAGSPPKPLPPLPSTRSTELEAKQQAEPMQDDHVYLSVSSSSNSDMSKPTSSDSGGPIVQWPSLKKSPRIPELNKGLPDPKKHALSPAPSLKSSINDSATDTILQAYTNSPNSTPPRVPHTPWLGPTIHPERGDSSQPPQKAAPHPILVSAVDLERESQPRSCTCSLAVKSTIEASFTALRAEIAHQFQTQKTLIDELLRAEGGGTKLIEENRWLRAELARVEKERGMGKGHGG